jgi:hypothetical protein
MRFLLPLLVLSLFCSPAFAIKPKQECKTCIQKTCCPPQQIQHKPQQFYLYAIVNCQGQVVGYRTGRGIGIHYLGRALTGRYLVPVQHPPISAH